jgi:hypothetical protein
MWSVPLKGSDDPLSSDDQIVDAALVEFRSTIADLLCRALIRPKRKTGRSKTIGKQLAPAEVEAFRVSVDNLGPKWLHASGDTLKALYERETLRVPSSVIEGGQEVKRTRFRFNDFFSVGDEFVLTGTNFGDQMGDPGTEPGLLHQLIVKTLISNSRAVVYLVIAPYELLEIMWEKGKDDLRDRSAMRLKMLQHDPRLSEEQRGRLHIFDHIGATSLSMALRDPSATGAPRGLVVVTPRWYRDEAGPSRMYFAVEQSQNREAFGALVDQIYPSIKVDMGAFARKKPPYLGGRTIDEICSELGVDDDPYLPRLAGFAIHGK